MSKEIRLGVTLGCPAGVGPEIILRALQKNWPKDLKLVVLGDPEVLAYYTHHLGLPKRWEIIEAPEALFDIEQNAVLALSSLKEFSPGQPNLATARAMVRYIKEGVRLCQEGLLHGLVTAPISKKALKLAGEPFPGHTEMLAHLTGAKDYAMAFYGERLKIVLVTIHVALAEVSRLISPEAILRVSRLAHAFLQDDLGLKHPQMALAALNPHASEGGLFGDEEARILEPAVNMAKQEGLPLQGPFPSDSLFYRAIQGEFDLVVSLYHDQGLIPFKLLHFEDGVNLTLGLPIVRTSVDHGTAYDIAGKGKANPKSLYKAIELAYRMVWNRLNRFSVRGHS